MSEMFIAGDPHWLSGGARTCVHADYANRLPRLEDYAYIGKPVDTAATVPHGLVKTAVQLLGQNAHSGKLGYHGRPNLNVFCAAGDNPTVGVELETVEKLDCRTCDLETSLTSNWFHFESDSSLRQNGHQGYELITEPLPPGKYRSLELWTGLQNVLVPWVESYKHACTGLHVHVGLEHFADDSRFGFVNKFDNMTAGKYVAAATYLCLCDRSFSDSVFLRRNTGYCQDNSRGIFASVAAAVDAGETTARGFVDSVVSTVMSANVSSWTSAVADVADCVTDGGSHVTEGRFLQNMSGFAGHGAELNCEHDYTIEFRRGKGTLNAVSVHRMVEFATSVVKYVGHMLDNPGEKVSKASFLTYVTENTTSAALKALAEKAKGN